MTLAFSIETSCDETSVAIVDHNGDIFNQIKESNKGVVFSKNNKSTIQKKLKEKNIPAMIYYKIPLHLQKVFDYLGYEKGDFPVSEKTSENILSIPMHPYLKNKDIDKICQLILQE